MASVNQISLLAVVEEFHLQRGSSTLQIRNGFLKRNTALELYGYQVLEAFDRQINTYHELGYGWTVANDEQHFTSFEKYRIIL